MSLEQALAENTAALNNLAALLSNGGSVAAPKTEKAAAPKADKPAPSKKAAPKEEPKEEAESEIAYETVKDATLAFVKAQGRDALMSILEEFGSEIKSAKDLQPGQYAEYLEKLEAASGEDVA